MSIAIMSQVWQHHNLKCRGHLLVLLALADCADADGCCYPSIRYLAKRALMTERHTARVIKDLETWRLLSHTSGGGFKNSNHYQINPDIVSVFKNPDMGSTETLTCTSYKTLTPMSEDPSYDPSNDPSYTENPSPSAQNGSLSAPVDEVFENTDPKQSKPALKPSKPISPEAAAFTAWFCDLLGRTGSQRPTLGARDAAAWADVYDKLTRLDGHTDAQLRAVATYVRKDRYYSQWVWSPVLLRKKKDGLTLCQKVLSIMGNAGIPTAPKEDIFTEPANWRERLKKAIPFADFSDQNWMDLGADIRIQVLNTRL